MADKILIVDDEKNVLSSFKKIMQQEGYDICTANNAEEGLGIAGSSSIDLLIMDIRMPGLSGLEALDKFKQIGPKIPIIIMTAYGTTETAISAMQLGAYDYIIKPFEVPQMKSLIAKALEAARLMKIDVAYEAKEEFEGDRIIGACSNMQQIYKVIGQVSASDMAILLRGESGTGKELIARAVYSYSHRKDKPFMVINSAAIPEALLESELFGYEKGAFTDAKERRIGKFEQCDGGTVFLDEIGDMPISIQAKILRVLENKTFERLGGNKTIKVDIRLIAATNRNLEDLIKEDRFRPDLYYRLNGVTIHIPPLKERKEDIPHLANYFIDKYNAGGLKDKISLSKDALRKLREYHWPGNVRELENVIKKAILFSKGSVILPEQILVAGEANEYSKGLSVQLKGLLAQFVKQGAKGREGSLYKDLIEEVEKALIIETLTQSQGKQSRAAKMLGISRPTLKDKIEKLGLKQFFSLREEEKEG